MKPPYAIGSVPSLSGHANAYRWRSLLRVRRHRGASKPQGSSERVLPWQITMDQIICASLSHTHYYWYEVVIACMLKIPAGTAPIATLLPYYFISFDCCCCHSFLLLWFYFAAVCRILRYPYCPCLVFLSALYSAAYRTAPIVTLVSFFLFSFFSFLFIRQMSLFPSIFCTISAFFLYGEYDVRSFLPNGVFLPCDHGLDFLHQLIM